MRAANRPQGPGDRGYPEDLDALLGGPKRFKLLNFGCNGVTSSDVFNGKCLYASALKVPYTGSQLGAALKFIDHNRSLCRPVSRRGAA